MSECIKPEVITETSLDFYEALMWLVHKNIMTQVEVDTLDKRLENPPNDKAIAAHMFYEPLDDIVEENAEDDKELIRLYKLFLKEFPVVPDTFWIRW